MPRIARNNSGVGDEVLSTPLHYGSPQLRWEDRRHAV